MSLVFFGHGRNLQKVAPFLAHRAKRDNSERGCCPGPRAGAALKRCRQPRRASSSSKRRSRFSGVLPGQTK